MVDHYPGGREAVALRLGKTEETLRKELSGVPTHKLGVIDAETIVALCRDAGGEFRAAYAASVARCSGGYFTLQALDLSEAISLQLSSAEVMRETSDVAMVTAKAEGKGGISDNSLRAVLLEIEEAHEALRRHERALRAKHAQATDGRQGSNL